MIHVDVRERRRTAGDNQSSLLLTAPGPAHVRKETMCHE
jgi:hypothetical protein